MNNKKLKQFIKEASDVHMTFREKQDMLLAVLGKASIPSPYYLFSAFVIGPHKKMIAAVLLAVFTLTSGGTSYAAASALPGDTLYSFKININEQLQSLAASTPEAKALVGITHTSNRLKEAEVLSKNGKLTPQTEEIIKTNITKHAETIKENIAVLTSENATATVKEVISDLKASIETHEAVLATISSSTASTTSNQIASIISTANEVKSNIGDLQGTAVGTSTATSTVPLTSSSTRPAKLPGITASSSPILIDPKEAGQTISTTTSSTTAASDPTL